MAITEIPALQCNIATRKNKFFILNSNKSSVLGNDAQIIYIIQYLIINDKFDLILLLILNCYSWTRTQDHKLAGSPLILFTN